MGAGAGSSRALPALSSIANAILKTREGTEVVASKLWESQPVAILVLRRPGCILCRDEAQRLWAIKPALDRLGIGLVCVVHEWIQREVDAFYPAFWPGPLLHDPSKALYAALNGGTPLRGSAWSLLNPFSDEWRRIRAASTRVKQHNVVGDGLTMGGALLVRAGQGGVAWMHVEERLGLVAEPEAVLAAAKALAAEKAAPGGGHVAAAAADTAAAGGHAADGVDRTSVGGGSVQGSRGGAGYGG